MVASFRAPAHTRPGHSPCHLCLGTKGSLLGRRGSSPGRPLSSPLSPHDFERCQPRLSCSGNFSKASLNPHFFYINHSILRFHRATSPWSVTFKIIFSPFWPGWPSPRLTKLSKILENKMQAGEEGRRGGVWGGWAQGRGRPNSSGVGFPPGRLHAVSLHLKKTN